MVHLSVQVDFLYEWHKPLIPGGKYDIKIRRNRGGFNWSAASDALSNDYNIYFNIFEHPINYNPSGTLKINGTAVENKTLTLTDQITDQNVIRQNTKKYQWKLNGVNISGATATSYKLKKEDIGKKIALFVNYTDNDNFIHDVSSSALTVVKESAITILADVSGIPGRIKNWYGYNNSVKYVV